MTWAHVAELPREVGVGAFGADMIYGELVGRYPFETEPTVLSVGVSDLLL
jgi:hypothetical protein